MNHEQSFHNCRYFGKPECEHGDYEFLMKHLINLMDNNIYNKYLADKVNELQCNYCEVFKHRQ